MNDFLCYILFFFQIFGLCYFLRKKMFLHSRKFIDGHKEDRTCQCHKSFPLQETHLSVLHCWSVICVSAFWGSETISLSFAVESLSPHREHSINTSSVNVCWISVTMVRNASSFTKDTMIILQEPFHCSAGLNGSKMTTCQSIRWEMLHNAEEKHIAFYCTT